MRWKKYEMENYILWFLSQQRLFADDIQFGFTRDQFMEHQKKDPYIEVHGVKKSYFNYLLRTGQLNFYRDQEHFDDAASGCL